MHWINIDSGNGCSVEFQLQLNDYFPNVNLNVDGDFFTEKVIISQLKKVMIIRLCYLKIMFVKIVFDDKSVDSNVEKVYSDCKQCSLSKILFFLLVKSLKMILWVMITVQRSK